MKRLLSFPGRFVRAAWLFIEPPLKVGRIPFGRTVLVLQLIAAGTFVAYTVIKKDSHVPVLSSKPFKVEMVVPNAEGLQPAKEPTVGVAGTVVGKVTKVKVERGLARVTMEMDSDLRGKVFKDASAFVRPITVLQTLIVNIDPGDPRKGPMPDGGLIPVESTGTFVHIDHLTKTLDPDTQSQVQILIRELASGLEGREPQLRKILAEVGRVTDSATPLAEALAERRRLLRRLTDRLDVVFRTLGDRGRQLGRAVGLGSRTLRVTAERAPELSAATRELAPMLTEARRALEATDRLATPLLPALEELVPATRRLAPAARNLRGLVPDLGRFVAAADRLVDEGRTPARQLAGGLATQRELLRNDQLPALEDLVSLVDVLHGNRVGMANFADNISGATSTNRRAGTAAQFSIMNIEASPASFGLGAADARSRSGQPSRLARLLAEMLEHTCRDSNPAACLIRFNAPGLPGDPILTPKPRTAGEG